MTQEETPILTPAALRARRYRRRRADGVLWVVGIEITQDDIDLLGRFKLVPEDEIEREHVAKAMRDLLNRGNALADALDALEEWRNA